VAPLKLLSFLKLIYLLTPHPVILQPPERILWMMTRPRRAELVQELREVPVHVAKRDPAVPALQFRQRVEHQQRFVRRALCAPFPHGEGFEPVENGRRGIGGTHGRAAGVTERAWGDNVAQRRRRSTFRCDPRHSDSTPNPTEEPAPPPERAGSLHGTPGPAAVACAATCALCEASSWWGRHGAMCVAAMERIRSQTPALRRPCSGGIRRSGQIT